MMDTLSIFKISWRYFHHDAIFRLLNELYDSIGVVLCSLEILFGVWSLSSIVWFFKRTGSYLNRLSSYKELSAIESAEIYPKRWNTFFNWHGIMERWYYLLTNIVKEGTITSILTTIHKMARPMFYWESLNHELIFRTWKNLMTIGIISCLNILSDWFLISELPASFITYFLRNCMDLARFSYSANAVRRLIFLKLGIGYCLNSHY